MESKFSLMVLQNEIFWDKDMLLVEDGSLDIKGDILQLEEIEMPLSDVPIIGLSKLSNHISLKSVKDERSCVQVQIGLKEFIIYNK